MRSITVLLIGAIVFASSAATASAQRDTIKYVPKYEYPVFLEMEEYADSVDVVADSITREIQKAYQERIEREKEERKYLRVDFTNIPIPESPEVFDTVFYFPPVAQYWTGTCWCFSGTSLIESEVQRLTGKQTKLSEMHTVYWEWYEKARRFIAQRGNSRLGQGSETNAVIRMIKMHGAVPAEAYPGLPNPEYKRHNHRDLSRDIRTILEWCEEREIWDEDYALSLIREILDHHLGRPPETFEYNGQTYTPREFADEVLEFKPGDYVSVMSTLSEPFYMNAEFKVHDNWWHDSTYYNVPLDEWYAAIKKAIQNGYSLSIGGDISEPGCSGWDDAMVIPSYDIPQAYIDQHSREYRIYNESTGDDHGMHIVGYTRLDDHDWYLLKDSASRARYGEYEGYMFIRDDFLKLKMLTFTVHKSAMADLLAKRIASTGETPGSD